MKKLLYLSFLLLLSACNKDNEEVFALSYPDYFPAPVYTFENNELTKEKFELGRKLFYDGILSSDNTVSCGNCHSQVHAFADHNVTFSTGVNNGIGERNSPSITNMIWSPSFMWDGGVNHIEVFSLAPITNPVEMNETMANVIDKLNQSGFYKSAFKKAYGTDEITDQLLFRALTSYMAMVVSSNSRYDLFRQGKVIFTPQEVEGLQLFEQKCASCHTAPLFTNYSFQNNGLDSEFTDLGRGRITLEEADKGKFKVPSLRNIELTYPYMHDGRFWSLEQVLDHYDHGIKQSATLSNQLSSGIPMTTEEKQKIILFLKTLTDNKVISEFKFAPQ
jgi:cytochrome c peroxidase